MYLNPQKLIDYRERDLDYKTQAYKIICEGLGYEPPLNVLVLSELNLRSALKRYHQKEMTKLDLENYIEFQLGFINGLMMEDLETFNC